MAIVPLCMNCHYRYHEIGKLAMLQKRPGYLRVWVTECGARFLAGMCEQWEDAAACVESFWKSSYREGLAR